MLIDLGKVQLAYIVVHSPCNGFTYQVTAYSVPIMNPKQPCHRTRNVCHHCQQNLGYTALRRHRDLPHLYCPGYAASVTKEHASSDSESSDSTLSLDEPSPHSPQSNCSEHRTLPSPLPSSSSSEASDDSESGSEVWDNCSDDDSDSPEV